jgi:hypothetical protein
MEGLRSEVLRDKAFNALQTICRLSIDNELTGSIKKVPQRVHLISWSGFSNLGRRSMGRPETHYANAGDISIAYQPKVGCRILSMLGRAPTMPNF